MKFLEKYVMPLAAKLGQNKVLNAIKNSFAIIMPLIITGAVAVLLNNVVFKTTVDFSLFKWLGWTFGDTHIAPIMGMIWQGSLAVIAILSAFTVGKEIAKEYKYANTTMVGIVSLATTFMLAQWAIDVPVAEGSTTMVKGFGLNPASMGATGLFSALFFGILSSLTFIKISSIEALKIKMPESVPPNVAKSFAAIIPVAITMVLVGTVGMLSTVYLGMTAFEVVGMAIQAPFMALATSGASAFWLGLVYVLMIHLLWAFGLHGFNIMSAVFAAIWLTSTTANMALGAGHADLTTYTQPAFDMLFIGGAGSTLALLFAMRIFSKDPADRVLFKMALPLGLFNINEPVVFSKIVMNPVMIIPFITIPVLNYLALFFGMELLELVPKVIAMVPWTTPPVIQHFLASGFAWQAAIFGVLLIAVNTAIYGVFVKIENKIKGFTK